MPFTWFACELTCSAIVFELLDPGSGFFTSTGTCPTCWAVAVPLAVNCVELTNCVVSVCPPKDTLAPFAKLAPLTARVKLPTLIAPGEIEVIVGSAFSSMTVPESAARVSATLVAVTFTVLGFGRVTGAA